MPRIVLSTRNKEHISAYIQILIGCVIGGVSYPLFLVPNGIAPGGVTGIATIFHFLFNLPVGLSSFLMNLPLFLLSYRKVGGRFAFRSFLAMLLFSFVIDFLNVMPLTVDTLLGTVYGGILLGAGLGLILRGNATTGGTDMMARLVHKHTPFITVPVILFMLDCVVIIGAGIFIDVYHALYALICIFISTKVMDTVLTGFSTVKACFIISSNENAITKRLLTELGRGVTQLMARGAYTGAERQVILCVTETQELPALKDIVREEDENAFLFVTEAHEALGEGFNSLTDDVNRNTNLTKK